MMHNEPDDHHQPDEKTGDPVTTQQSSAEASASPPTSADDVLVVDSQHVDVQGDSCWKQHHHPDQELYRPEDDDLPSLETTVPSPQHRHSQPPRIICLFGLSADPPTGTGGHVGIVQALVDHTHPRFDEIHVLPVYRHTFAVRTGDGGSLAPQKCPTWEAPCGVSGRVSSFWATHPLFEQDKRTRLVSFEHRWHMCQIAFGHLSVRVVVSDAEYQSWKWAVRGL
jgi:hypothetical protein